MVKELDKVKALEVLNSLEVIESEGGDCCYALVQVEESMLSALAEVGISKEKVDMFGDGETTCIVALATNEGIADYFFKGKLHVYTYEEKVIEVDVLCKGLTKVRGIITDMESDIHSGRLDKENILSYIGDIRKTINDSVEYIPLMDAERV